MIDPRIDAARRAVMRWKETRLAYLGDGEGRIYVPNSNGAKAYVRFVASSDSNGNPTFTSPVTVNVLPVTIPPFEGAEVRVGYDDYGELAIVRADSKGMARAGISPRTGNALDPQNRFIYPEQIVVGQVRPVGTATNPSSKITWQTLIYDDLNSDLRMLTGPSGPSGLYDLQPFVPAVAQHRVVVVWLDTYTGQVSATGSVPKSMTTPINFIDYQEADDERPADSIPLGTFILRDDNPNIDSRNVGPDIRQFIARPSRVGNPNPVKKHERVWPDRQALFCDTLSIVSGSLEIIGDVCVL